MGTVNDANHTACMTQAIVTGMTSRVQTWESRRAVRAMDNEPSRRRLPAAWCGGRLVGAWLDVLIVMLLLVIGGLFTATELALVSLRAGHLSAISAQGRRGARVAALAADPSRFLSAVQIGSIVAGFFAAAYATATLADPLARQLMSWGVQSHTAAE